MDKTSIYDLNTLKEEMILLEIREIVSAIKEKGYNPTNQLVGYLLSGDETFITSHNNARKKIKKYGPKEILMVIINGYLGL